MRDTRDVSRVTTTSVQAFVEEDIFRFRIWISKLTIIAVNILSAMVQVCCAC